MKKFNTTTLIITCAIAIAILYLLCKKEEYYGINGQFECIEECKKQGGRTPAEKAVNFESCKADCGNKWSTGVLQLAPGSSVPITTASAYSAPARASTNRVCCEGSVCPFSGKCLTTYTWRTNGCLTKEKRMGDSSSCTVNKANTI